MSRNGEAHGAFYGARNHAPPEGSHPLMSGLKPTQMEKVLDVGSPESRANIRRTMGKTDARSGGWAGHLVGDTEPQTVLAYHVKTAKRRGEMERNVPVVKKTPGKPFKPKGR